MNGLLSRGSVVLSRRGDRILPLTAPHPVTPGCDLSISWQRGAPRGTDDIPGALWTARCSPRGPAHLPRDPLATGLRSSSYPRNHGNRQRPGEGRAPGERPAQRPSFSLDTDRFFSAQEAGAVGSDNVPARAQGAGPCVTKRCGAGSRAQAQTARRPTPTTPCSAGRHGHVWGVSHAVLAPLPPRRVGIELFAERRANNSADCAPGSGVPSWSGGAAVPPTSRTRGCEPLARRGGPGPRSPPGPGGTDRNALGGVRSASSSACGSDKAPPGWARC